ncbi:putative transcription initiation factor TFIID subunit 11-like [Apostichopus japonicus]|uniref:Putative transcription initiation factor TFIID subunit 11-like n=2 Tax=Stichopus japonicus TaxID=307972 RepID=A0A2G8KCM4_STIJA|nr:putative transcription initiation factor TFIID subunit 11-like [Apostichopus japonicus]
MAPTVSKPSAKEGSEATNTKTCVTLKKVSAYSNDFFKINKQIIDTTDEFGGIKLSDILTKEATRNISKSDTSVVGGKPAAQSDNKVLPGLHDDVSNEEESDLMLKGRQAPATVKHQGRKTMDDVIESNDVTSIESKVSPPEEAGLRTVSTHDVKEVWCEDTDDGKSSSSDVIEDDNTRFSESPGEAPDREIRSSNDYVITEKILRKLQPPVPHVIWPENKFMTQNTSFVYGSPSRLAPVIVPVHSVDCPISKMFFPSKRGNVCPPNSPTGFLTKEYGFYPVERHYGYSDS